MNGLLPTQFAERIEEPRTRQDPPKRLWKAIVEARKLRRRDLVAIDEEAYAEPLVTALFLYRRDKSKHRQLVLSALGSSSSAAVWRNLAAAARDAWDCSDAALLGALAYRADEARERQARPRPPDVALALIKQFTLALDFEAGHLDAPQFVQSGLGYLRLLPATFVVPDDLVLPAGKGAQSDKEGSSGRGESWPILRALWLGHSAAWQAVPAALDEAGKLPCGFLEFFVERHRASQPPEAPSAVKRPENPFTALAGGHALEPPEEWVLDGSAGEYELAAPTEEAPVRSDSPRRPPPRIPWELGVPRMRGRGPETRSLWEQLCALMRSLWEAFRRWLNRD
jgi:hypothetical protein